MIYDVEGTAYVAVSASYTVEANSEDEAIKKAEELSSKGVLPMVREHSVDESSAVDFSASNASVNDDEFAVLSEQK